ncbi:winged helix DNA-binding protein [Brevibacillus sp. 179-C9.3 HS]|uniref:winged helix DNA-binding protein n=3 Tax=Brevibacillus TaxID=55080 RepID=UPI0039A06C59
MTRLYESKHYALFSARLTEPMKEVLCIIGESGEINKQSIIDTSRYSKTVVHACVEALYFSGLLKLRTPRRETLYSLSEEGQAFVDYLLLTSNEGGYYEPDEQ